MANVRRPYNTNSFCSEVRNKLWEKEIELSEHQMRQVYHAVFGTLCDAILKYGVYAIPTLGLLRLRRTAPRQYTARRFLKGRVLSEVQTVTRSSFRFQLKMSAKFSSLLHQSCELPVTTKQLKKALDVLQDVEKENDWVPNKQ
jgi:hypothetical protein